jgi:hypothetical protein
LDDPAYARGTHLVLAGAAFATGVCIALGLLSAMGIIDRVVVF